MKKALVVILIALWGAAVIAGCGGEATPTLPPPTPMSQPPPPPTPVPQPSPPPTSGAASVTASGQPVAAWVNGQPVLLAEYQKQVAQFEAALVDQGLDSATEEGRSMLAQIRRQVLEALIDQALIEQAAAQQGITIADEELEARIRDSIETGGGQARFEQWLAANNMTRDDFKAMLRSQLLTEAMIERVTGDLPTTAEQVHARHILLMTEAEAQTVLSELQAGGDFAALAEKYSVDESTKYNGGDLGFFPRGLQMVPKEVEDAAFGLEPGQISGVVQSPFGFHIVQVVERDPARPLSEEMRQALRQATFDRWLQDQRTQAAIEIMIELG